MSNSINVSIHAKLPLDNGERFRSNENCKYSVANRQQGLSNGAGHLARRIEEARSILRNMEYSIGLHAYENAQLEEATLRGMKEYSARIKPRPGLYEKHLREAVANLFPELKED